MRILSVVGAIAACVSSRAIACSGDSLSEMSGQATAIPIDTPNINPQADSLRFWRTSRHCGINCLYMLLRANSVEVPYEELERRVPVGPQGSSMLDLRNGAEAVGLATSVVRATPFDLSNVPLPVIAHLEDSRERGGHFVIIVGRSNEAVQIIDGTTALSQTLTADEFRRAWSGHLLVVRRRSWPPWLASMALGALCLASFWWWRARRVNGSRDIRHGVAEPRLDS